MTFFTNEVEALQHSWNKCVHHKQDNSKKNLFNHIAWEYLGQSRNFSDYPLIYGCYTLTVRVWVEKFIGWKFHMMMSSMTFFTNEVEALQHSWNKCVHHKQDNSKKNLFNHIAWEYLGQSRNFSDYPLIYGCSSHSIGKYKLAIWMQIFYRKFLSANFSFVHSKWKQLTE